MTSRVNPRPPTAATLRRLERASGSLATQAVARMDDQLTWFRAMPADQRSWVMLVAQAGIASLVEWCRTPDRPPRLTGEVFGAAPRELVRAVPLRQTVDLIRVTLDVLEDHVGSVAEPGDAEALHTAVLLFSREVAFATAHVYASFAENRGAWDARLEALVVDALVRGERSEELPGRAAALGWATTSRVVVAGRRRAHHGSTRTPPCGGRRGRCAARCSSACTPSSWSSCSAAARTPRATTSRRWPSGWATSAPPARSWSARSSTGCRAPASRPPRRWPGCGPPAPGRAHPGRWPPMRCWPSGRWPGTRWPARPSRTGSPRPWRRAGGEVMETVRAVLATGGNLEASARALFVHPNTVRYRLRRAADLTGLSATDPRGAWTLQVALALDLLDPRSLALALSPAARRQPDGGADCGLHHRESHFGAPERPWLWEPSKEHRCRFRAAPHRGRSLRLARWTTCWPSSPPDRVPRSPGCSPPWLDLPGAEPFFRWAGAIADADLLTLGTTGDAEAIADTAVTQPLVVAMSLFVARELGGLPGPVAHTPQTGRDVVITGHSVGELTAAVLAGVLTIEAAIALTAVRGRAMARACALTPTGMSAVLGGDPTSSPRRWSAHGLVAANLNGGGQVVVAGPVDGLAALKADPPAKARVMPLSRGRRLPHRVHGPGPRGARGPGRRADPGRPQPAAALQRRRRRGRHRCRAITRIVSQITSPVRFDACLATLRDLGVTAAVELPPAGALPGSRSASGRALRRVEHPRAGRPRRPRPRACSSSPPSAGASEAEHLPDWRVVVSPVRGTVSPADHRRGHPPRGRHPARLRQQPPRAGQRLRRLPRRARRVARAGRRPGRRR